MLKTLLVISFALGWTKVRAETLSEYGKIDSKTENDKFQDNCTAIRDYPEIEGMSDKKIQEMLNKKFKKILTVGKKLRAQDCPSKDSNETYVYKNSYAFGALKGAYLSLDFHIYFPGGSGRFATDCRIFDLRNGKEIKLNALFNKKALPEVQELLKAAGKKEEVGQKFDPIYHPEGLTPETSSRTEVSSFCLNPEGLSVMYSPYDKFKNSVLLPKDKLEIFFKKHDLIKVLKAIKFFALPTKLTA